LSSAVAAARRMRSLGSSVVAVEGCAAESGLGGKVVGYGTVVGAWVAAGGINSADDGARGGRRCVIGAMAAVDAVSFDVLSKNSSSTEQTGRSGCRLSVLLLFCSFRLRGVKGFLWFFGCIHHLSGLGISPGGIRFDCSSAWTFVW